MRRLYGPLAVLVVLAGLFFALPSIYNNQALLFNMMVYLALAQGLNLLYGFTGYLPFGYVGFYGTGAYAASLLILFLHWTPILAVATGGIATVLVGLLLSPLLRLSGAYFSIANPDLTSITRGPYGIDLSSVYNPQASYYTMLAILLLATGLGLFLRRSRFGLSLEAIREDPISAGLAGVNVTRGRIIAWLMSALVAGLSGGAFAWYISVFYPQTVFDLSVSVFAIVFVLSGGAATVLGPLIGTAVLYGLYNVIGISTPQYFQLTYGLLIVLLVLFLPAGLVSLFRGGRRVL